MCTALNWKGWFGRTLDLECSYGEQICIVPRNAPLVYPGMEPVGNHCAIIGMALVAGGVPLFYDGANEHGLCMAGLNFPGNARYFPEQPGKVNVPSYGMIPMVLTRCENLTQARQLLQDVNVTAQVFAPGLPSGQLHWIISDGTGSIVVESTADGLHVYDNPVQVMTNNPIFPQHLFHWNHFKTLGPDNPPQMDAYCVGLGGLGLPGDLSSMSRFVRCAFHSRWAQGDDVGQFFHLLGSVEMPLGSCHTHSGHIDRTVYISGIHRAAGEYYYTTDENRQISCVSLRKENLEGETLLTFPLIRQQQVHYHN